MKRALLIGYGNTLREDDGAGVRAAECAAGLFPGVDVITVHELQPELAETVSRYAMVVFLDAAAHGSGIRVHELGSAPVSRPDGSHSQSPEALVSLSRTLYGRAPERTLLMTIPGQSFGFGEKLSHFTEEMVEQAVKEVGYFLAS